MTEFDQLVNQMLKAGAEAAKRRSSPIDERITTEAARTLGGRPKDLMGGRRRTHRTWTGFVSGQRCWIGRKVQLPNGGVGWIKKVERGLAIVRTAEIDEEGYPIHLLTANEVRLWKLPEAVLLGGRKKGIVENPSPRKAESCRQNGRAPVRPGQRPRGRPRKTTMTTSHKPSVLEALRALLGERYPKLTASKRSATPSDVSTLPPVFT